MQRTINVSIVLNAVRRAGQIFLAEYKRTTIAQDEATLINLLAGLDDRCFTSLKADLIDAFPETPWIIGDEFDSIGQKQPLDLPEYWLCDAMDGAIQYLQHLPGWTINLVLIRDGRPYLSVIYAPLEGDMFWGQKGAGAFLNNDPIRPSTKTNLRMMLAVFEYGHPDENNPTPNLNRQIGDAVTALLDNFGIVRNYGPHGLQVASVGAGRIDLFYQQGLDTFNWLAGILIAQEAGADVLNTDGQPWTWGDDSLIVAAPGVAQKFLDAKAAGFAA